jgi:hypothetical protein
MIVPSRYDPNLRTRCVVSMAKKVAILQSSYISWKGYFDIAGSVDEFILYDDENQVTNY